MTRKLTPSEKGDRAIERARKVFARELAEELKSKRNFASAFGTAQGTVCMNANLLDYNGLNEIFNALWDKYISEK